MSDFTPHETFHFGFILTEACHCCTCAVQLWCTHLSLAAHLLLFSVCAGSCKENWHNTVGGIQVETTLRFRKEHNLCFVIVLLCKSNIISTLQIIYLQVIQICLFYNLFLHKTTSMK